MRLSQNKVPTPSNPSSTPDLPTLNCTISHSHYRSISLHNQTPKFAILGKLKLRRRSDFTNSLMEPMKFPVKRISKTKIAYLVKNLQGKVRDLKRKGQITLRMGKRGKMSNKIRKLALRGMPSHKF